MIMSAFGIHYGLLHLKTFDKIYKSTCLMIVDIYPHSLNTIKFWKEMINDMYKDADTQPKPKIYLVKNTEKLLVKAIKFDIIQTSFEEYECRVEMKKLDSNKIFIEKYKMYNNSCKLKCSPCCVNNENIIDYSSREYYKNVLSKYNDALSQQCSNFNSATAIGITFLVFDSVSETLDFKMKFKSVRNNSINLYSSKISDAPNATDLIWENLAYVRSTLMFRRMCTILILLIVLIFFTTPTVCLKIFNIIDVETFNISESISKIGLILPTYLLFIFTLLLPNVCYLTIKLWKHKLISNFRQSVMITTSVHLIMMALIFPALGVTSINAVLVYFTLSKHDTDDISWDKVFSFTSSSFFVNYLITNCFIGCCVELLRIPDLLLYFVKIMGSKSSVERRLISEKERFQFNYGKCYAELVCICSIVITYSLICPIITIFGFLYFLFRQFVDRYNLFYEYKALHVSVRKTDKMHRNALFLTFSGTIVQQFFMLLLNYVRKTQQKVLLYIQFSFLIFSIWMGMGFLLYYNYKYGAKIERVRLLLEERENIDNEYLNYESLHSVVSKIQNPKVVQQLNTMIEKEM
ncbi:hypothetical protein A3Q56_03218 [Intoshia linei]|uniref:CSC1/OSCA1-like 7TM region domain-containing protein n=1 Tax=Intoshia linei TaxID=1819745 RepID=A0A177B470_9BILA|nr:hypothetical protein A3Q56_03218 [Intoshia linei]